MTRYGTEPMAYRVQIRKKWLFFRWWEYLRYNDAFHIIVDFPSYDEAVKYAKVFCRGEVVK